MFFVILKSLVWVTVVAGTYFGIKLLYEKAYSRELFHRMREAAHIARGDGLIIDMPALG